MSARRIRELESDLRTRRQERTDTRQERLALSEELARMRQAERALDGVIASSEADKSQLLKLDYEDVGQWSSVRQRQSANAHNQSVRDAKSNVDRLNSTMTSLRRLIAATEQEMERLAVRIEGISTDITNIQREIERLRARQN